MKLTLLYCALYLVASPMINMTTGLCSENAELKIKVAGHGTAGSFARGKHFFLDYVNTDFVVYSLILFSKTNNYITTMSWK